MNRGFASAIRPLASRPHCILVWHPGESDVQAPKSSPNQRDNSPSRLLKTSDLRNHTTIPTMASRAFSSGARALTSTSFAARRTFQTSAPRLYAEAAPLPARKPMGAFRGGYVVARVAKCIQVGRLANGSETIQALRLPPRCYTCGLRQLLLYPGRLQGVE